MNLSLSLHMHWLFLHDAGKAICQLFSTPSMFYDYSFTIILLYPSCFFFLRYSNLLICLCKETYLLGLFVPFVEV